MRKRFTPQFKADVTLELLREDKPMSRIATERGVATTQLNEWKSTARKGLVRLFEDEQRDLERQRAAHEEERAKLYAEIGRLATQLAWLKKKLVSTRTRRERVAMIDWDGAELDLKTQAALLEVNRSGLYYQPVPVSPEELAIKRRIDEIYTATPFYGSPKITAQMNQEGWGINHKRVERYMREMGLAAIYPGPNLSKRRASEGVWPYLLRDVEVVAPQSGVRNRNRLYANDKNAPLRWRGWWGSRSGFQPRRL